MSFEKWLMVALWIAGLSLFYRGRSFRSPGDLFSVTGGVAFLLAALALGSS